VPALVISGEVWFENRFCLSHAAEADAAEREKDQARKVRSLIANAGGNRRMSSWSLTTYPDDAEGRRTKAAALDWLDRYTRGERPNMIAWGPVGTGKTSLCWSVIRQLCEAGVWAKFVSFRQLLTELRRSYTNNVPCHELEQAERVSVLALDDVGAERPTDWAVEQLAGLVEIRYQGRLPLLVSSNYDLAQLARRIGHDDPVVGQRLVSRLAESSVQVRFAGADRRIRPQ
jgi:DNA replication protein DnaC